MAEIAPFRALRYNPAVVPDLAPVVTPPYDVISPEAQAGYYARHPYNVIRLILAREGAEETRGLDRYQAAARTYRAWREHDVLCRDPHPAIYPYEQTFAIGGRRHVRRGVFALLKLAEYGEGIVFPHERTFPRHKNDRLLLMRACPAHLESILVFYPGPATGLVDLLARAMQSSPVASVTDDAAVAHRLWSVSDPAAVSEAVRAVKDQSVIIADGHHRYETALTFRDERSPSNPRAPERFVLVNLVHAPDPGLLILPTHRVIRGEVPADTEARLARRFRVERLPIKSVEEFEAALEAEGKGQVSFIFYAGPGRAMRLIDMGGVQSAAGVGEASAVWPDASVLHQRVLGEMLEVPGDGDRIAYTHSAAEAVHTVDAGRATVALLMRPPTVEQVQSIALGGGRMPQKSTYFYPKLLSGLIIHHCEPNETVPEV